MPGLKRRAPSPPRRDWYPPVRPAYRRSARRQPRLEARVPSPQGRTRLASKGDSRTVPRGRRSSDLSDIIIIPRSRIAGWERGRRRSRGRSPTRDSGPETELLLLRRPRTGSLPDGLIGSAPRWPTYPRRPRSSSRPRSVSRSNIPLVALATAMRKGKVSSWAGQSIEIGE
ncbi:hypothetical protein PoB_005826700 [Plakobranchus ocellatus]|uniref:Uncharacterized protein n=1 Tax=Plakobranchus ocellatus TaxID=259542 RepID=A0AAV4CJR5_9GAST|nr:hypothetical protein PoB_005826700 [Plakobranchus ocellatus]